MSRAWLALAVFAAVPAHAQGIAQTTLAAQGGNVDAEFAMGEAYRTGRGVTPDPESAIMWYRRAALQGSDRASQELGFALFAHGDRREAMPYIEKAAAEGEPRAFYLLGTAHFNGDYATRDWPLAYAQTERAAQAGLAAAQKNLALMDHYLLPVDKTKADEILATLPPVRKGLAAALPPAPRPATPPPVMVLGQAAAPPPPASKAMRSAPPKPERASAPAARGEWKVQLGAFGSADRARAAWKALSAKVGALADLDQRIVSAGAVQRLQAAGISDRAAAEHVCKDVRQAGGDCLVMAP